VDLIQALTGSSPVSVFARAVRAESDAVVTEDNAVITLSMANGSVGTVIYTALGDKAHERERVEIFGGGAACVIENFKTLTWSHNGRRKRLGNMLTSVDRGHRTEIQALIAALRQGQPFPVPFESYVATTRATFAAIDSLCTGRLIEME
jgi:predicted dehydrogenase